MGEPEWVRVHYPLTVDDPVPPERKVVAVMLGNNEKPEKRCVLPMCGYLRYSGGDRNRPYFVVYHGNPMLPADVIAWCACIPEYESLQPAPRGESGAE